MVIILLSPIYRWSIYDYYISTTLWNKNKYYQHVTNFEFLDSYIHYVYLSTNDTIITNYTYNILLNQTNS